MDSNTFSLPKRKSPWQRFGASHDLFSVVTVSTFSCLNSDTFADLFVSWWYGIWIPNFESRLKLHRLGWSDHFVVIKRWQHYKMGIILVCWLFTLHLPSPFLRSATSNKHKTTHLDLEGHWWYKRTRVTWMALQDFPMFIFDFPIFIWTMLISNLMLGGGFNPSKQHITQIALFHHYWNCQKCLKPSATWAPYQFQVGL